jgi:hypothetical protein
MATDKQIKANRQNAKLGGVKTEEGKKVSRLNALKHGFVSKIVTEYDKIDCKDFCKSILSSFSPKTVYEDQLVEILTSQMLAYRRISFIETELFRDKLDQSPNFERQLESHIESLTATTGKQKYLPRIEGDIIDQLEKFQRYKTATINSALRIGHELERLEGVRSGNGVPPPMVLDVGMQ